MQKNFAGHFYNDFLDIPHSSSFWPTTRFAQPQFANPKVFSLAKLDIAKKLVHLLSQPFAINQRPVFILLKNSK
jgi:hypothetical protein